MDNFSYLIHYNIQGSHWGIRRWQNEDGTWTSEGLERRRMLEEVGGSRKEIRKANKEGKIQVELNKKLYNYQNKIEKKFDKKTEKILSMQRKGNNNSKSKIKKMNKLVDKAISLGMQHRMIDYIGNSPDRYYNVKKEQKEISRKNSLSAVAFVASVATLGVGYITHECYDNDLAIQRAYMLEYKKAKDLTIEDLKKYGIERKEIKKKK